MIVNQSSIKKIKSPSRRIKSQPPITPLFNGTPKEELFQTPIQHDRISKFSSPISPLDIILSSTSHSLEQQISSLQLLDISTIEPPRETPIETPRETPRETPIETPIEPPIEPSRETPIEPLIEPIKSVIEDPFIRSKSVEDNFVDTPIEDIAVEDAQIESNPIDDIIIDVPRIETVEDTLTESTYIVAIHSPLKIPAVESIIFPPMESLGNNPLQIISDKKDKILPIVILETNQPPDIIQISPLEESDQEEPEPNPPVFSVSLDPPTNSPNHTTQIESEKFKSTAPISPLFRPNEAIQSRSGGLVPTPSPYIRRRKSLFQIFYSPFRKISLENEGFFFRCT